MEDLITGDEDDDFVFQRPSRLNTLMWIISIILLILIVVLCFCIFYVPSKEGTSVPIYLKEIFDIILQKTPCDIDIDELTEEEKEIFQKENCTLVLCKGDDVFTSDQTGIKKLVELAEGDKDFSDYSACDNSCSWVYLPEM